MDVLQCAHLYSILVELKAPWELGRTPLGRRVIYDIIGGRIDGRVKGTVLSSGGDWILVDSDEVRRLDVRTVVRLDDGELLYTQTTGRIRFPQDVLSEAKSRNDFVAMDPNRYHYRFASSFETASVTYHWLNYTQAVGIGRIVANGIAADVFEV